MMKDKNVNYVLAQYEKNQLLQSTLLLEYTGKNRGTMF